MTTVNELASVIQANDSKLSFQGEKFFVSVKYNLKSKDVDNIELQLMYEEFLRKTLEYNYRIPNSCFNLSYDITLILNGVEYEAERVEKFIERQGGWLKYKITDTDSETDTVLQTFYVLREANLVDLCT